MYVALVPNRNSPPAYLLREGYREDGKVKSRTLANLSHWPLAKIERLRRVLRDEVLSGAAEGLTMLRSLPHGHVAAVLGITRKIGLDRLLAVGQAPARLAALVLAMILARVIDPASKLATARQLDAATATSSLGPLLELGTVSEQELYAALDWLLSQQSRIESRLAQRHLSQGTLVLYDVSSTYFEGRTCPLARRDYSRDGKRDKLQIIFGLLCASDGCPVAVEVFEGNTGDPSTLAAQITKLKQRFHLDHVVLVGDRGMITEARVETVLKPAGLDWITALRAPTIRMLLEQGAFQLSLFDERDLAEVTSLDFPDERLVVCRNPWLAAERARKRRDLLAATEADLRKVVKAVARKTKPLRGADKIGLAAGAVLNRHKVAKHFILTITDDTFGFDRNTEAIEAEGRLAVDLQAVSRALCSGLAASGLGTLRGCDDGRSRGGSLGALMIVEQNGSQRLTHVPLEIIGEHAQQHVGTDPIGQAVVDRPDLKIDGLDGPERAFGLAQALIEPHDIAGGERCLVEIGADDIEAIEPALGLDGLGVAVEAERIVGDGQDEVLGHLMPIEHRTGGEADLVGAAQRFGLAGDSFGHLAQVGFGGGQQVQTFAGTLGGEPGIAADHQTVIGKVRRGHLGKIAFVEQRELERALLQQRPDGRRTQCGDPVEASGL